MQIYLSLSPNARWDKIDSTCMHKSQVSHTQHGDMAIKQLKADEDVVRVS